MDKFGHREQASGISDRLHARWDRLARSGVVTLLGLLVTLAVLVTLWMAHLRGSIHKLTTTQEAPEQAAPAVRPGGQDLIRLTRFEVAGSMGPQFTGATLAPGDGMLLLQVALSRPGRGESPILLGTGETEIAAGEKNVQGAEFSAVVETRDGNRWSAPVEVLAGRPSRQQSTAILPGGSGAEAKFSPDVMLPTGVVHTGVETAVSASVTSRGVELIMSAKNTATAPRAVTLSWRPKILTPEAGMQDLSLVPPALPSIGAAGVHEEALGRRDLDQTYSTQLRSYLGTGPELLLRNLPDGYALRFTALAPSIRSLHVQAGAGSRAVLLSFSTAAGTHADDARTVVAPGETLQWRLRMEAVPSRASSTPLP